jgi:hypothetical protein
MLPSLSSRLGMILLASTGILATNAPAHAILSIHIYESGSDVQIDASGSLNLPIPLVLNAGQQTSLGVFPNANLLGTGALGQTNSYNTGGAGPSGSIGTGAPSITSTGAGIPIYLFGTNFKLDNTYTSGSPIVSSATIPGKTLAQLGLSATSGLLATWTLQPANGSDPYTANDTVQVFAGPPPTPPAAAAPGPLPLCGAAAAFGFSRQLRRRLKRAQTTG